MARQVLTALFATTLLIFGAAVSSVALAENSMGYRLLSAQEAAGLPRNHGALGIDVERSQDINEPGMTFELMRVKQVKPGSPGAQAEGTAGAVAFLNEPARQGPGEASAFARNDGSVALFYLDPGTE